MEITVLKDDLQKAINIASRFVSSHPPLPILSHILLRARRGTLSVIANNLEVGVSINVGASVKTEGEITVHARTLAEVVSTLPKSRVEVSQKEGMLELVSEGYSVTLPTTPANDFPSTPGELEKGIKLPKKVFQDISQYIVFTAGNSEIKPEYSGVLFLTKKEGSADVVATDGVRLSKKSIDEKIGGDRLLIPAHVIGEVSKIFAGEDVTLSVDEAQNQALFATDGIVLTTRLLTSEFPDFEKIIPERFTTRIVVEREELLNSVQLAGIFAQDYKIEFAASGGELSLSSNHPQLGSQTSKIPAKIEGDDITVAFNWRFIKELLSAIDGQEVAIELTTPIAPGVFRDPKMPDFLHLIMPIRIQSEG